MKLMQHLLQRVKESNIRTHAEVRQVGGELENATKQHGDHFAKNDWVREQKNNI